MVPAFVQLEPKCCFLSLWLLFSPHFSEQYWISVLTYCFEGLHVRDFTCEKISLQRNLVLIRGKKHLLIEWSFFFFFGSVVWGWGFFDTLVNVLLICVNQICCSPLHLGSGLYIPIMAIRQEVCIEAIYVFLTSITFCQSL